MGFQMPLSVVPTGLLHQFLAMKFQTAVQMCLKGLVSLIEMRKAVRELSKSAGIHFLLG